MFHYQGLRYELESGPIAMPCVESELGAASRKARATAGVLVAALVALSLACGGPRKKAPVPPPPPGKAPVSPAPKPAPTAKKPRAGKPSPLGRSEPAGDSIANFEARVYRSVQGQQLFYRLFRPSGIEPGRRYPLVIFLHGASASGSDNEKTISGPGEAATALWTSPSTQGQHSSFVLVPQSNPEYGDAWVRQWRPDPDRPASNKESLELLIDLLVELERGLPIDRERIAITGLSMGGFGVWSAITRYPGRFAAAVPVCGGGDPSMAADSAAAIWAFHGDRDTVVPVGRSREMVDAFRAIGAEVKYTEYPGVGHNSWDPAFAEPGLAEWLFSQRRSER